jgi:hypothetical protein
MTNRNLFQLCLISGLAAVCAGTAAASHLTEQQVTALESTCEKSREAQIAPLREQAIKDCIAQSRSDPAFCRQHFKDFGDARQLGSGRVQPRMLHNILDCASADEARRHYQLNPRR